MTNIPPFTISPLIVDLCSTIYREIGHLEGARAVLPSLKLRREQYIRTIQASLAIEGNTLSVEQIMALMEGRRVIGPSQDIQEAQNAIATYEQIDTFDPLSIQDFLKAHKFMMSGLIDSPGVWRTTGVGIFKGSEVAHMAPPAKQVSRLVENLFHYLKQEKQVNFLIKSCICHYEIEFIHPFLDGNGRIGRLWQQLLLMKEHTLFRFLAIEELIRANQDEYYKVLSTCDKEGQSTQFIEFMLGIIGTKLKVYRPDSKNFSKGSQSRLNLAHEKFLTQWFGRKEYNNFFPEISSATASRDLQEGVESGVLIQKDRHNKTKYCYV